MKAFITVVVILTVTMVNGHDFKGPLNLKNISATTFNVEDELQLVVGTTSGKIFVSRFSKRAQIINYQTARVHFASIIGIKRLATTRQYITVGQKGIIVKFSNDLKKQLSFKPYDPQTTKITNVAFITNEETVKGNTRFALNFGNSIAVLSTVDLTQLEKYNCSELFNQTTCTVSKIAYINNILLVHGHDSKIVTISMNGSVSNVFKEFDEDFEFVSQFISPNDHKSPDGIAITDKFDIVHFNLSNTKTLDKRSPIIFDSFNNGDIRSLNYCKRRNYNPATNKAQKLETIILVGLKDKLLFFKSNNEAKSYVQGEFYNIEGIIEVQCQEDEAYVLAKNGKNDILQILNLEFIYDDPEKDAGYASFFIVALILVVVFYQIKKYRLSKQIAKEANHDSKYVQLEERITVSKTYNH